MLGICPNCENRRGKVGEPCPEQICRRKGYCFIPENWYQAAKDFARQRRKAFDPLLGRNLDRYLLIGKLGEGGMGAVYLALQRPLNREVALKLISGLDATQSTIARFEREAQAISVLDHPNIVKLHDYGVGQLDFQVPYMALEYVKHGRTLRRAFAQMREERGGAPIPGDIVLSIFSQILNALGAAHVVGIIHRDMKPENVMIAPVMGNPYFVKVLDFGLAKVVGELTAVAGTLTRTEQFLGTPYYMAPEQTPHMGEVAKVDHRADLYAVAIMLYEVFTGVRPFHGESALEVMRKKVDPSYDPLSLPKAQGLPRTLREFLRKGMAKDPEARFASAQEMLSALEGVLTGRVTSALGFVAPTHSSSEDRPKTPVSRPVEGAVDSAQAEDSVVETELVESSKAKASKSWLASRWYVVMAGAFVIALGGGAFWFLGTRGKQTEVVSKPDPVAAAPVKVLPAAPEPKPAFKEIKESVAEQALPPSPPTVPRMRVRFDSEPKGAEVFSEGRLLGKTPFEEVFVGDSVERQFEFKKAGYRTERVKALIKDGADVRVTLSREARPPPPQRPKVPVKRKQEDYPEP